MLAADERIARAPQSRFARQKQGCFEFHIETGLG